MRIVWSPLAIERISEIAGYIARDSPSASRKWVEKVFEKVLILQSAPNSGRVVPETNREEIRELIYGNYRILYRLEQNMSSILTVRHVRQILPVNEIGNERFP